MAKKYPMLSLTALAKRADPEPLPAITPPSPPPPPVQAEAAEPVAHKRRRRRDDPLLPIANRLLRQLQERYPMAFTDPPRPLAIGIHTAVFEETGYPAAVVSLAMRRWTKRPAYFAALAAGGPRYALDGTPQGEVSEIAAARPPAQQAEAA